MKKIIKNRIPGFTAALISLVLAGCITASAAEHTVVPGDSLWKIAVRYQVGLSEIISANPHFKNPHMIYPGDRVHVPQNDPAVLSFEEEVVRLVNLERAKSGLAALKINWELSRAARYKSKDMSDNKYFSHNSPTYGSPFDMIKSFGISYRSAAENIAYGQKTPQAVINSWMNSSGHRANILGAGFTQIGVGYYANGNYWTQMFIG